MHWDGMGWPRGRRGQGRPHLSVLGAGREGVCDVIHHPWFPPIGAAGSWTRRTRCRSRPSRTARPTASRCGTLHTSWALAPLTGRAAPGLGSGLIWI
jgi:hypothetical protein